MTGPDCAALCNLLIVADPDNILENSKEAGREAQGTQGSSKNCTRRESAYALSRLIRGFL